MYPFGVIGSGVPLPSDRYWCACDTADLPNVLLARAMRYRDRLRREGRLDLWRRTERTYYGQDSEGGMASSTAVTFGGEAGEMVMVRVNHFASIVTGLLATAVSRRPSYEPRATNTDTESAQQVTLARSLLEFYSRKLSLETLRENAARTAVLFGEGYTALRWNPWVGKPIAMRPDGTVARDGDVEAHVLTPLEVVHDLDDPSREWKWVILAYRENVWELIARYPQQREKLLAVRGSGASRWPRSAWGDTPFERPVAEYDSDIVTVWWLYHVPTDAMPQGRHAQCIGDIVLEDRGMDLSSIPVQPLWPEREVSSARGHSKMFDLLCLQESYDSVTDSVLSQADAHGTPNVIVPKGTDIQPENIVGGMNFIEWEPQPDAPNAGIPQALNLLDIPPAMMALLEHIKQQMETLPGVNSVVRGDPMPQLKSGAALALVQSLAVAFNTALQAEVVKHDEMLATRLIELLKRYADTPRQVEIVGRAQKGAMTQWTKDRLSTIERVIVEVASPLQEHTSGKLEIAQQLLSAKLITTPQEYIEVLTTGRLEPVYFATKAMLDLIARENEELADGKQCVVRLTDDHMIHVKEHAAVLSEAAVRGDERLSQNVLMHINAHSKAWLSMGPELGMLTGQSAMPPPIVPQAGPPPQPPHAPSAPGLAPPPPDPSKARPMGHPPPPGGPSMPRNPLTGAPAPNPGAT